MTASLATLTLAATTPSIDPQQHNALITALAPALAEAVHEADFNVRVDDRGDPWSVLVIVRFVDARVFGEVTLRYGVAQSDEETCRKAHGGFDDRMARVEWAEYAFVDTAFFPPRAMQDALMDRVHYDVVQAGREAMRRRSSVQDDGGVA